jgi:hypothetical protein
MKIQHVTDFHAQTIEADDGHTYMRFSASNWYQWHGESLEPCFSKEEQLEAAYQAFISS